MAVRFDVWCGSGVMYASVRFDVCYCAMYFSVQFDECFGLLRSMLLFRFDVRCLHGSMFVLVRLDSCFGLIRCMLSFRLDVCFSSARLLLCFGFIIWFCVDLRRFGVVRCSVYAALSVGCIRTAFPVRCTMSFRFNL